jgi:hypothetical protein
MARPGNTALNAIAQKPGGSDSSDLMYQKIAPGGQFHLQEGDSNFESPFGRPNRFSVGRSA